MNKFNFLISQFQLADFPESLHKHAMFSFTIEQEEDMENIQLQLLHKDSVYLSPDFSFSFYFNLIQNGKFNEHLGESLLKYKNVLLQLIFHPCFKCNGGKPVIFVSLPQDSGEQMQRFVSTFESCIKMQGYEGIEWCNFNAVDHERAYNFIYPFQNSSVFEEFYYGLLQNNDQIVNTIGIINNSDKSQEQIVEIKRLVENKFKENYPSRYYFLLTYNQLQLEVPLLKEKLKRTAEDLMNQKTYLNIIREEDEANKINRFYYYEYEILPLWYKKMGHLIKVLTGKRRFRSLFNNNVKKYKH